METNSNNGAFPDIGESDGGTISGGKCANEEELIG